MSSAENFTQSAVLISSFKERILFATEMFKLFWNGTTDHEN